MCLLVVARCPPQSFDEIVKILRSLPSVKDVKISISAHLWGEAFAADSTSAQTYITAILLLLRLGGHVTYMCG